MRKIKLITTTIFATFLLLTFNTQAQEFRGLDKSPMDAALFPTSNKIPQKTIKVVYSRPQLKGRELKTLVPNGEVWRTGANEATNITFYKDAKIGGKPIKAGEYSLFTIPGDNEWTIILSKDINVWGAYSYNKANDIIRVPATVSTSDSHIEAFSIAFKDLDGGAHMLLGWGSVIVTIPITM